MMQFLLIEITIGFVRETDSVQEDTPGFIDICAVVLSGMLERSATVTIATAEAGQGFSFASGNYILLKLNEQIYYLS